MAEVEKEKQLDFERKHEKDLQYIRNFRLMDDDFMSKVFEDKTCAEFLLQIILNRDDLIVQEVHGQHDLKIYRAVLSGWTFWPLIRAIRSTISKYSAATEVQEPSVHGTTAACSTRT